MKGGLRRRLLKIELEEGQKEAEGGGPTNIEGGFSRKVKGG